MKNKLEQLGRWFLSILKSRTFWILFGATTLFVLPYFFIGFEGKITGVEGDAWQVYDDVLYLDKEFGPSLIDKIFGFFVYMLNPFNFFNERSWRYPLHLVIGSIHSYNLFWIFSFYFSTFVGYALSKEIVKNREVAIIGALLLSFVPAHFAYGLGFGTAVHVGVIYVFILGVFRFKESLGLKSFLLMVISFAFLARSEPHYAFFGAIFGILYVVFLFFTEHRFFLRKKLRPYYFVGALCLLGGVFFAIDHYQHWDQKYQLQIAQDEIAYRSINLIGLVTPYSFHPIWGDFFHEKVFSDFFGGVTSEQTVYVGVVVLFLVAGLFFCGLFGRYRLAKRDWLFALLALLFLVIGIGPLLQLKGVFEPEIRLPYDYLFQNFEFFSSIRAIGRAFIYFYLFLVLLLLPVLACLFENAVKKVRPALFWILLVVVVVDFYAINPKIDVDVPAFFTQIEDPEENRDSIVVIPGATSYIGASKIRTYLPYHDYRVYGDRNFARQSEKAFEFEKGTPILNDILYIQPGEQIRSNLIFYEPKRIASSVLSYAGVRYIFIDRDFVIQGEELKPQKISEERLGYLRNFIEILLPVDLYLDDEDSVVYEVKKSDDQYPFLTRDYRWKKRIEWMPEMYFEGNYASFDLIIPEDEQVKINFLVNTLNGAGSLVMHVDGKEFVYDLNSDVAQYVADLGGLDSGEYEVQLFLEGIDGSDVQFTWFDVRAGELYDVEMKKETYEAYSFNF